MVHEVSAVRLVQVNQSCKACNSISEGYHACLSCGVNVDLWGNVAAASAAADPTLRRPGLLGGGHKGVRTMSRCGPLAACGVPLGGRLLLRMGGIRAPTSRPLVETARPLCNFCEPSSGTYSRRLIGWSACWRRHPVPMLRKLEGHTVWRERSVRGSFGEGW